MASKELCRDQARGLEIIISDHRVASGELYARRIGEGRLRYGDLWISDDLRSAPAVAICAKCPSRRPCAERGREEVAGIWGGVQAGRGRRSGGASHVPAADRGMAVALVHHAGWALGDAADLVGASRAAVFVWSGEKHDLSMLDDSYRRSYDQSVSEIVGCDSADGEL